MYRFLLRPRWIAAHLVVVAAAVTFSQLGLWQLRRHDARREHVRLVDSRGSLPAAPLVQTLRAGPDKAAYRRVRVAGTYDPSGEILLRGRELAGRPGYDVLTPLVVPDGRAVIVDRGWVPAGDSPPFGAAPPPDGPVEITGVLQPSQRRGRVGPQDPPGKLQTIGIVEVPRLASELPYPVVALWLQLSAQEPAQPGPLPALHPPPEPTAGRHLGYAVQWFAFIPTLAIGYGFWLRSYARKRKLSP